MSLVCDLQHSSLINAFPWTSRLLVPQRAKQLRDWEAMLDDEDSFRIPIGSRIEDSLDVSGLQTASLHEAIPESNKGFQMLPRMGWKGRGLGANENGASQVPIQRSEVPDSHSARLVKLLSADSSRAL